MKRHVMPAFVAVGALAIHIAWAAPGAQDRVYTADQNSNTVSVINPATNSLLGQNYISVIDPTTYREIHRIETTPGPGMVQFLPDGNLAFVVSSFNPAVDVVDVKSRKVIKRIPVVSPFSPFLQFTPDFKEMWMTHKDLGKDTRIDTRTLEIKVVIDTGMITNHLAFAKTAGGT